MKRILIIPVVILMIIHLNSCNQKEEDADLDIIFLHHSTGKVIWNGEEKPLIKIAGKISDRLAFFLGKEAEMTRLFKKYNKDKGSKYGITEKYFPKASPYGWNNFPYDYYNIWVKNAGGELFMEEPTLDILTKEFQVIIFKHCFPVSNIQADNDSSDINSDLKTLSNYKLQYAALRNKLHQFPGTKFILFTGAAQVRSQISDEEARNANEFFKWVLNEWDMPDDNIYLWDLYNLQTEGGLFFLDEYAVSSTDSHPNQNFAGLAVKLLFNRIIDIVENDGKGTNLKGEI